MLPPLPFCFFFDFLHFKFPGVHFPPASTLSVAITIHLGPLAFYLSAQSLHISLNILQYSNTVHIKSSELPFIYQTSTSSHLAEKEKKPPRCHFMLLALALTCAHLHRGIVNILSCQPQRRASMIKVWICSLWRPGLSLTEGGEW